MKNTNMTSYELLETLYFLSSPRMKQKLIEGKNTKIGDCVPEDDIKW